MFLVKLFFMENLRDTNEVPVVLSTKGRDESDILMSVLPKTAQHHINTLWGVKHGNGKSPLISINR